MTDIERERFADTLTALGESEMQLFRMMLEKPYGAILTADIDIMIAKLLAADGLMTIDDDNKVFIPDEVRNTYVEMWSDELILRWRKRNWMYKCLDAAKYLYGVMSWDALKDLFALRYPNAGMDEIRELYQTTPNFYDPFIEVGDRLILNGYQQENFYQYLEKEVQADTPYYIPTKEQVEELYDRGCLLSGEAHTKLKDFIRETFACGEDLAEIKLHEIYEDVNNRVRLADIADNFASGEEGGVDFTFTSDEAQYKFFELLMEMSRECRLRDNRGHDWYEMAAIMANKNRGDAGKNNQVKRVKIGRNDPCPCGSGKKYKNCCLRKEQGLS